MHYLGICTYNDPKAGNKALVEHGGSGGKAAAPIAKKVIKKVLERHELRERIDSLLESKYNV